MNYRLAKFVGRALGPRGALSPVLFLAATTLSATTYTVTVAGLGGEPDYEQRFGNWAKEFEKNVSAGGDEIKVDTLSGPNATKAKVRETLERISREAKQQDSL